MSNKRLHSHSLLFSGMILASCLLGCGSKSDPGRLSESLVANGTPEAIGLIQFLNAPTTTIAVLDNQVPLDRRAAENLIAHRNGPDGLLGTGDDDLFDNVDEIDLVKWVGKTALQRLLAFVNSHGWVPAGDDLLGVWDGVAFSVNEAEAVLAFVNSASRSELDDDLGLDRRAVTSILDARPIESILQLSGLYYVGRTALVILKDHCAIADPIVEIGLISDLDRTVIPPHSDELPEAAYPGVAALYNELEYRNDGEPGDVYYVTAREPDRIIDIPDWLELNGVPGGPIETGISGAPWYARDEKVADISAILNAHPEQVFILIGDSNHVDPEVFQDISERFPDQISAGLIHRVNNVNPDRVVGLHLFENHAEAAAILFGLGELSEDAARGAMTAAKNMGLEISTADIDQLIEQNRP